MINLIINNLKIEWKKVIKFVTINFDTCNTNLFMLDGGLCKAIIIAMTKRSNQIDVD